MSFIDDAMHAADEAVKMADKVKPWWPVIAPLLAALEDGKITEREVVIMCKAAMLRGTEEKLKAELKP